MTPLQLKGGICNPLFSPIGIQDLDGLINKLVNNVLGRLFGFNHADAEPR